MRKKKIIVWLTGVVVTCVCFAAQLKIIYLLEDIYVFIFDYIWLFLFTSLVPIFFISGATIYTVSDIKK
jgi:hypothetical protein